jgi:hypothetical protein
MHWVNIDSLRSTEATQPFQASQFNTQSNQSIKPQSRWGQACVTANNNLYIIGGYDGK